MQIPDIVDEYEKILVAERSELLKKIRARFTPDIIKMAPYLPSLRNSIVCFNDPDSTIYYQDKKLCRLGMADLKELDSLLDTVEAEMDERVSKMQKYILEYGKKMDDNASFTNKAEAQKVVSKWPQWVRNIIKKA